MTRCAEPGRWTTVPGADAAEEEVASYLAHVSVCPFHAAIERREEARVRGAASLARGDLSIPFVEARGGAAESGDRPDARPESRPGPPGRALSIRVDGVERARLNLLWRRRVTLEAEAGALVAVWQPGRGGADEGEYLTSYLLPAGAKQASETVRAGGRAITFTTEAREGGRVQLTVACTAPGRLRAQGPSAARHPGHPSDEPAPALRRLPARPLALALCALAAVVLLGLWLFLPNERPAPVARQEQPARTAESPTPSPPAPEATPSDTHAQNRQEVAPGRAPAPPAPQRAPQDGGRVAPRPRTREQMTVADVRRVYVGEGEGASDRQLREALIERLRAGDRFIVVTGERQADAVLLRERTRNAGVSVQLVTRAGKTLWFTTQPGGAGGVEDVGDLAARIVAALTAAADKGRPPAADPRR